MPVDRSAIDAQLREIGEGERWWEQREFRELPYVLNVGERIQGITLGKLLGRRRPRLRPAALWLLVATDQRLLCLKHKRFARKQVDIAWGQIARVQQSSGMGSYQLVIATPEQRYRLRISKVDALRFVRALDGLIPRSQGQRPAPELGPLSWIPGMTTVAAIPALGGIVSKVAMLSPPDYATQDHVERLESAVERLQSDVDRLQQQVAFLEELLQKRATLGGGQGSAVEV